MHSCRRLITDNALVAYECLHTIRKQKSKKAFFALKIDMMKAYDRVDWSYLHGCLMKLGFNPTWIQSVMRCVTLVRNAMKVNGDWRNQWSQRVVLGKATPSAHIYSCYIRRGYHVCYIKKRGMENCKGSGMGGMVQPSHTSSLLMILSSLLEVTIIVLLSFTLP